MTRRGFENREGVEINCDPRAEINGPPPHAAHGTSCHTTHDTLRGPRQVKKLQKEKALEHEHVLRLLDELDWAASKPEVRSAAAQHHAHCAGTRYRQRWPCTAATRTPAIVGNGTRSHWHLYARPELWCRASRAAVYEPGGSAGQRVGPPHPRILALVARAAAAVPRLVLLWLRHHGKRARHRGRAQQESEGGAQFGIGA